MGISDHIDRYLFVKLVSGFITATVIGTLSHEMGHLTVGWLLGYTDSQLHFGSASPGRSPNTDSLTRYRETYKRPLKNNGYFTQRARLDDLEKVVKKERLYIGWGGPAQTMLTGTIGLVALLLIARRRGGRVRLTRTEWIWVFVALFWLRQSANFAVLVVFIVANGRYGRGDETRLANQYGLPIWSISAVTAVLSILVLYYVTFKFIPWPQRLTFVAAGLVGGVTGYVVWLGLLGPVLIP